MLSLSPLKEGHATQGLWMELAESVLLPATPNPSCLQRTASRKTWESLHPETERRVLRLPVLANVRHSDKLLSGLVETSPSLSPTWKEVHTFPFHRHQSPRSTLYSKLHLSVCPENPTCHTCPHPTDLGVN